MKVKGVDGSELKNLVGAGEQAILVKRARSLYI